MVSVANHRFVSSSFLHKLSHVIYIFIYWMSTYLLIYLLIYLSFCISERNPPPPLHITREGEERVFVFALKLAVLQDFTWKTPNTHQPILSLLSPRSFQNGKCNHVWFASFFSFLVSFSC